MGARSDSVAQPGLGLRRPELLSPFTRANTQHSSCGSSREVMLQHQTETSALPLFPLKHWIALEMFVACTVTCSTLPKELSADLKAKSPLYFSVLLTAGARN